MFLGKMLEEVIFLKTLLEKVVLLKTLSIETLPNTLV